MLLPMQQKVQHCLHEDVVFPGECESKISPPTHQQVTGPGDVRHGMCRARALQRNLAQKYLPHSSAHPGVESKDIPTCVAEGSHYTFRVLGFDV